ncbi:hypothetical protein SDC9_95367 [bioreactor metagenome]|uniref:Uncharacterized protein n=1 Tax=bioreactor metagenome TaxID=1076179 RepID=A0A645A8N6_9ZZZZ
MPAVVNSTVGSFSGISEADGITACPLDTKKSRYSWRSSLLVMDFISKNAAPCGKISYIEYPMATLFVNAPPAAGEYARTHIADEFAQRFREESEQMRQSRKKVANALN